MTAVVHGDVRDGGELVERFADFGITAFTTGRAAGSFGTGSDEPVREVMARWSRLRAHLGGSETRLATATTDAAIGKLGALGLRIEPRVVIRVRRRSGL